MPKKKKKIRIQDKRATNKHKPSLVGRSANLACIKKSMSHQQGDTKEIKRSYRSRMRQWGEGRRRRAPLPGIYDTGSQLTGCRRRWV